MEKNKHYNLNHLAEMKKTTLWLLWRVYECWNLLYWDLLRGAKSYMSSESREEYGERIRKELREADIQHIRNWCHPFLSSFRRLNAVDAR
jgi:hypothetical protein